jgi:starch synthase (maltosyl-transferring)
MAGPVSRPDQQATVPRKPDRRSATRDFEHVTIECVSPEVDAGRYPAKRVVGDIVEVGADIFRDGHDMLAARVLYRGPDENAWREAPLEYDYNSDRWSGSFVADRMGRWTFTVEAWTDHHATLRDKIQKKKAAGQDVTLELREEKKLPKKPTDLTRYPRELQIVVDQPKARFSSWYEFFPRSCGTQSRGNPERGEGFLRHGTFSDAAKELPRIAKLGFDVVYLPPIHPIGRTFRKGKNNTLEAKPDDVGSPWAIGNELGGHTAIEPALGTIDDFDAFVAAARKLNIDVALDYALQCSPDHPWVKEHPDWFHMRPDGSIAYAENPPKKYQDIYPINFWSRDRENLWNACRDVVLYWIDHGVKIFRVDNPHTKAFAFWEWMIADVQAKHPDAVFFAEAFTRPKRMKSLAKLGFTMSYTYFTWKNSWWDLRPYVEELQGPMAEFYRPNFFANTPDILNEYLVEGGRPAFRIRLLLAATLSSLYGIYSGYELIENVPVRKGSEEYLDSEKYQLRHRDWNAPGNINEDIARINRIRREQPALQRYDNTTFHESENPVVLFYGKSVIPSPSLVIPSPSRVIPSEARDLHAARDEPREGSAPRAEPSRSPTGATYGSLASLGMTSAGLGKSLLIAVTTDPAKPQESMVHVPLAPFGLGENDQYVVRDLLTGSKYTWRGSRNYVRLDPVNGPIAHILVIEPKV